LHSSTKNKEENAWMNDVCRDEVRCAIQDFLAMAPNDRGALRRRISLTPEQTKISRFNDLMEQHGLSHKTDHVFGKKRL
jgi:hypothetical protein